MRTYGKYLLVIVVSLALLVLSMEPAAAQCPMCKAAVETSLAQGDTTAIGINKGILYLLLAPYVLYSLIFLAYWYTNKKNAPTA